MALNDLYLEHLARFKQHEKPEAVLVIVDNPQLIGIAVAWGNLDIHCSDNLTEIQDDSEHGIWDWLWENTEFSFSELKIKACLPCHVSVVPELLAPLIGNRVIYPDGTVNSYVQRYLRKRVLSLFKTGNKQNARKGKS